MDPGGLRTKSGHQGGCGVTDGRMDRSVACPRLCVMVGAPGYVIVYDDICDFSLSHPGCIYEADCFRV